MCSETWRPKKTQANTFDAIVEVLRVRDRISLLSDEGGGQVEDGMNTCMVRGE